MTNMPFILVTIGQAILLIVGQMDISIGVQIAMVNVICIMVPQEFGTARLGRLGGCHCGCHRDLR